MTARTIVLRAVLAGAASALPALAMAASADPHAVYTCEDATRFSVRFADARAFVTLSTGAKLVLPQQASGSGFRYSSGKQELRGKGREALWTVGRRMPVKCMALQP